MLIKPIIATSRDTLSSLPYKSQNRSRNPFPYSGEDEETDYIGKYGKLLSLSLLFLELQNKANKYIHDNNYIAHSKRFEHKHWCICSCPYAKLIRGLDMNISFTRCFELMEVL